MSDHIHRHCKKQYQRREGADVVIEECSCGATREGKKLGGLNDGDFGPWFFTPQAQKKADEKKRVDELRATWIREHGSTRLKKTLEAGLLDVSLAVYRDERLAFEWPGSFWDGGSYSSEFEWKEGTIRNPSERALDQLNQVREREPSASLVTIRMNDDEGNPMGVWLEAVRIDEPLADDPQKQVAYLVIEGTR